MGRPKGSTNSGAKTIQRPKINTAVGAKDSFKKLHEQGFLDENHKLTPKAERYVRAKLEELGMGNLILFENFFLKGCVDYSELLDLSETL